MDKSVFQYKVLISKDIQTGTGKSGFTAYVPKLGIADDGFTVEEALRNARTLIRFHLDCLIEEGKEIPAPDGEDSFVTSAAVTLPSNLLRHRGFSLSV